MWISHWLWAARGQGHETWTMWPPLVEGSSWEELCYEQPAANTPSSWRSECLIGWGGAGDHMITQEPMREQTPLGAVLKAQSRCAALTLPGNLFEMQSFGPHPILPESETQAGASDLDFNNPSRGFWCSSSLSTTVLEKLRHLDTEESSAFLSDSTEVIGRGLSLYVTGIIIFATVKFSIFID